LPGRHDLRRIRMMSGLSGCDSGAVRCALWRGRPGLGCWLDRLPYRAVDVGATMHTTNRGEYVAIDQIHESTTNPRHTLRVVQARGAARLHPAAWEAALGRAVRFSKPASVNNRRKLLCESATAVPGPEKVSRVGLIAGRHVAQRLSYLRGRGT
jgi:hypothetical protein